MASAGDVYASENGPPNVEVVRFDGATDAMIAVVNGQIDATLQDLPAAFFYRGRYPELAFAGEPVGRGYYVLYFRHGDEALRDAIDAGIASGSSQAKLRRLYERYGIWNDTQNALATLAPETFRVASGSNSAAGRWFVAMDSS